MAQGVQLSVVDPEGDAYQNFEGLLDNRLTAQDFASRVNVLMSAEMCPQYWVSWIYGLCHKPYPFLVLEGILWTFSGPFWILFSFIFCFSHWQINMLIQKLFVIVTLSRHKVQMVPLIGSVPLLGAALQKPFREHLEAQKAKLHHHAVEGIPTEEDWMSWLFEKVGVIMVCFFVCSIVNFMAQSFASAGQGRVTAVPSTSEAPTTPFLITALPPG
nr:vacuole membrane protein 1-like isoform X2 [Solea senegalensis]